METIVFLLIVFLSNVIQGITGFAGTILAMPPSLMLVGYNVAKPILNVLGLLSGLYVFAGNREKVCWTELKRIIAAMSVGIVLGILVKGYFADRESILYPLLGIFVLLLSAQGLVRPWREMGREKGNPEMDPGTPQTGAPPEDRREGGTLFGVANKLSSWGLLGLAGLVHGIFVSGGPLLIGYLTKRIHDKGSFRATISTVWIVLNSIILADDIRNGLWGWSLLKLQLAAIPFLLSGMFLGGKLVQRMSQRAFLALTYVLLLISGLSLLFK